MNSWLAFLLNRQRAWRVLLLMLLTVISYLALSPAPPPSVDTGWDKLNHLLAFASLAVAACFSARASRIHALRSALALLAYGALIEILQTLMPPRQGEWADLLADAIGIALGLLAAALLQHLARRAA